MYKGTSKAVLLPHPMGVRTRKHSESFSRRESREFEIEETRVEGNVDQLHDRGRVELKFQIVEDYLK